jgi:hypothetical protein
MTTVPRVQLVSAVSPKPMIRDLPKGTIFCWHGKNYMRVSSSLSKVTTNFGEDMSSTLSLNLKDSQLYYWGVGSTETVDEIVGSLKVNEA